MIDDWIGLTIFLATAAFLTAGALAPIESLRWWAGWIESDANSEIRRLSETGRSTPVVIYLSGIASISGDELFAREQLFLQSLQADLPDAILIDDVFPYAAGGAPLSGSSRIFARIWNLIEKLRLAGKKRMISGLVSARNVFQVLVSADRRYGPLFNFGVASMIVEKLIAHDIRGGADSPISIIGLSGGGQVAIGAASFLKMMTGAPLQIISIGGVLATGDGAEAADAVYHLNSKHDRVEKLGRWFFPNRWPIFPQSIWNKAKASGKIAFIDIPASGHAGEHGYLGDDVVEHGRTVRDITAGLVVGLVMGFGRSGRLETSTLATRR